MLIPYFVYRQSAIFFVKSRENKNSRYATNFCLIQNLRSKWNIF